MNTKMRVVKVSFANGDSFTTNINGTDSEIRDYYKIGRFFNLGIEGDNMQPVTECTIIS